MPRLLAALLPLLALTACYDFVGEQEEIGFASNLVLGGEVWTPEHAVAAGQQVVITPRELLKREGALNPEQFTVELQGRRVQRVPADGGVGLRGEPRGKARLTWEGPVSDGFELRFRRARGGALVDLLDVMLFPPARANDLVLLSGGQAMLAVRVQDWRGRALGYDDSQLSVQGEGEVEAWLDDGTFYVRGGEPGEGRVRVKLGYRSLFELPIEVVEPAAVSRVSLHAPRVEDQDLAAWVAWTWEHPAVQARAWTRQGARVLGTSFTWTSERTQGPPLVDDLPDLPLRVHEGAWIQACVQDVCARLDGPLTAP